jgi:primosomal protein N'
MPLVVGEAALLLQTFHKGSEILVLQNILQCKNMNASKKNIRCANCNNYDIIDVGEGKRKVVSHLIIMFDVWGHPLVTCLTDRSTSFL